MITDGKNCFENLVRNTAYLHEGKTALHAELLCNLVLGDGITGKAAEVRYHGKLNYFNYCISSDETGIFIEKTSVLSMEPYFQKPEHCRPCLLLRKDMIKEFPYKLEEYCINHGIPSGVYKSFQFSDLADAGFILVAYNRSDGHANHLLQYPSINISSSHITEIRLDSFYSINLEHPLLKKIKQSLVARTARKLPVFWECTNREYESTYNYDDYDGIPIVQCSEDIIFQRYEDHSKRLELEKYMTNFQNIFNYRFTKN